MKHVVHAHTHRVNLSNKCERDETTTTDVKSWTKWLHIKFCPQNVANSQSETRKTIGQTENTHPLQAPPTTTAERPGPYIAPSEVQHIPLSPSPLEFRGQEARRTCRKIVTERKHQAVRKVPLLPRRRTHTSIETLSLPYIFSECH